MPSLDAIPPTAESYLRRMLRQGLMPFRYRSGVRSLLGIPASGEDAIIGAAGVPPIEFRYALPQSLAPIATTELLTAEQWLEAEGSRLKAQDEAKGSRLKAQDPDSDKERNPSNPRTGAVGAAPSPRPDPAPAVVAPKAAGVGATPTPRPDPVPAVVAPRAALPQVTFVDLVPTPTLVSQTGEPSSENPSTPRADAVGVAPPPRPELASAALAPKAALPQVTPVDLVSMPTLVSQTAESLSENLSIPRIGAVGAAPPPRSGQELPALAPRVALPQVTQAGEPPSEASLGGPADDPGSAARTHKSSVQSAGFTAVPAAMDNRKAGQTSGFAPARVADTRVVRKAGASDNPPMGNVHFRPSVVSTPMPLVDAPPRVGVTTSAYQPASGTAEQIARLRRTVAELTAQVAAQRHLKPEGSSNRTPPQFGSGGTPLPPFSNRDGTPRSQTPRAFWERSYLNRLYRWSGR